MMEKEVEGIDKYLYIPPACKSYALALRAGRKEKLRWRRMYRDTPNGSFMKHAGLRPKWWCVQSDIEISNPVPSK